MLLTNPWPALTIALVAGFAAVAVVFVLRAASYVRRHRPLANRRFMREYRASHGSPSHTTGAVPSPSLPLIHTRTAPMPAARPTHGRHAA